MPLLKADERVKSFDEVQLSLSQEMAVEEAKRCLGCGCSCIQACPYDVIQFNLETGISHKCNLCSERVFVGEKPVCVEVCMTDAIYFGEYELVKRQALDAGRTIIENLSKESILYVK